MNPNKKRLGRSRGPDMQVSPEWAICPRTTAWDTLWRRILGGPGIAPAHDAQSTGESQGANADPTVRTGVVAAQPAITAPGGGVA